MAILDLQLWWHWVWLLQMGSSYTVMVFQREMWKGNFQHWITTTVRLITASIISLHINLMSQLWIYISSPLIIDPARMKDPTIPQILYQMPSLLPLKIILVLWPPLLFFQIYFLIVILKLFMLWINICLSLVWWKFDNSVGNMIKKYATKIQGSIALHALIITRNFIIVVGFPGLFQRQVLVS